MLQILTLLIWIAATVSNTDARIAMASGMKVPLLLDMTLYPTLVVASDDQDLGSETTRSLIAKNVAKIQAVVRCYIARQRFYALRRGAILIQTTFRGSKARPAFRKYRSQKRLEAANVVWRRMRLIQCSFRGYASRRRTKALKALQDVYLATVSSGKAQWVAANMILTFTRKLSPLSPEETHWIRSKVRQAFCEKKKAQKIQALWRGHQVRELFRVLKNATVRIQALWRSPQVREVVCARRNAAVRMQALWQGRQVREKLRAARIRLQAQLRREFFFKLMLLGLVALEYGMLWFWAGIFLIQRSFRGYASRRRTKAQLKALQDVYLATVSSGKAHWVAANMIVTFTRKLSPLSPEETRWIRSKVRQAFCEKKKAQKIQALWRGHQVRELFRALKNATIRIQALWRSPQVREVVCARRNAAVRMQALWRGRQVREKLRAVRICLQAQLWREFFFKLMLLGLVALEYGMLWFCAGIAEENLNKVNIALGPLGVAVQAGWSVYLNIWLPFCFGYQVMDLSLYHLILLSV
jgi:Fe-S cluster biosynthesis and repair protein YggX